jgi:hypothetical protein
MTLVSAPLKFMSATLQPQVEDFQNENRKFVSGCEYAIPSFLLPFLLRSYLVRLIRRLRSALEKGKKQAGRCRTPRTQDSVFCPQCCGGRSLGFG